jgi:hypothetical protein
MALVSLLVLTKCVNILSPPQPDHPTSPIPPNHFYNKDNKIRLLQLKSKYKKRNEFLE